MILSFADEIISEISDDDSTYIEDKLFIYGLIRSIHPDLCVEIGTHRGMTSLFIANALKDNGGGHLVTCDPLDFSQEDNFDKFPELRCFITFVGQPGASLKLERPIDFLFVDGFHQKGHVLGEILRLFPQLSSKAVVLFHDAGGDVKDSVGVNAAVAEAKLHTVLLPTRGRMHIYSNFKL